MKLICGICEIDEGDTLHVYDARSGNPVHVMAVTADGETTHVLPINDGDCIVIVPHAAMRVDTAPHAFAVAESDREWAARPADLRENATTHVAGVGDL